MIQWLCGLLIGHRYRTYTKPLDFRQALFMRRCRFCKKLGSNWIASNESELEASTNWPKLPLKMDMLEERNKQLKEALEGIIKLAREPGNLMCHSSTIWDEFMSKIKQGEAVIAKESEGGL